MTKRGHHGFGLLFNEVAELYDRVRPSYPDELFADLARITGLKDESTVLEVGCGTGQATRSLAKLGCWVTAVDAGPRMAALARERLAGSSNVEIETSHFEDWDDRGRRFDLLAAASAWHWVEPSVGWRRAHEVVRPGRWMALLSNIAVRRPGEAEVYAETADLHERWFPGNPEWGNPPLEEEVRASDDGWVLEDARLPGLAIDTGGPGTHFGAATVKRYPSVQWFDGDGFADLLRSMSVYRKLDPAVREPLLEAISERIRVHLGDRVPRRYLSVLRAGPRAD